MLLVPCYYTSPSLNFAVWTAREPVRLGSASSRITRLRRGCRWWGCRWCRCNSWVSSWVSWCYVHGFRWWQIRVLQDRPVLRNSIQSSVHYMTLSQVIEVSTPDPPLLALQLWTYKGQVSQLLCSVLLRQATALFHHTNTTISYLSVLHMVNN
jgi:hypothetical protein